MSLLTKARRILWVVIGDADEKYVHPEFGLITGLARVARSENEDLTMVVLNAVDDVALKSQRLVQAISHICCQSFISSGHEETRTELEYTLRNSELLVPRLIADQSLAQAVDASSRKSQAGLQNFHQSSRPLKLHVASPGLLDSLKFVDDEAAREPLGSDQLEIKVKAFGVNFKDVFVALGQMKASTIMAGECAGLVVSVGQDLQSRFQVGDRVFAFNATPYASRARVSGTSACKMPSSMTFEVGASIPVVYGTAYHSLVDVGQLREGDKILIHAASGGVGQAAIMIAKNIGAEIFATAGSREKQEFIMEKFGIARDHIFSSKSLGFKDRILRLTNGRGVDVVLNSTSGEALRRSWECIASFGRFIELGKFDMHKGNSISMEPFDKHVTFSSIDLTRLANERPNTTRRVLETVLSHLEAGLLTTLEPITTMPVTEIERAFRNIQSRRHIGKIVLKADEESIVKAVPPAAAPLELSADGTYVIAGGLGSLGQNVCRMMAKRGAKHIVVRSRRDMSDDERVAVEEKIDICGANLHVFTCDITDWSNVQRVTAYCRQTLPPVKGIVHSAGTLQVSFRNRRRKK